MMSLKRLDIANCTNSRELINLLKYAPNFTNLEVELVEKIRDGTIAKLEGIELREPRDEGRKELSEEMRLQLESLFGQLVRAFSGCRFL